MLKSLLFLILLFIVFITTVLAILFHDVIKTFRMFRSNAEKAAERAARKAAAEEEYFRRTSTKYYHDDRKPEFDSNYFKGSGRGNATGTGGTSAKQDATARRTTTSSGVTIIDQRDEKKIFADEEGEYVDFEEVKG